MTLGIVKIVITIIFVFAILKYILPARGVRQITINELKERLDDEEIQLIDVRHPLKYRQFHIYGFDNIPLSEIKKRATNLSMENEVITICQTGTQGNQACKKLKRLGFKNLANVRGGLSTWTPVHVDRS